MPLAVAWLTTEPWSAVGWIADRQPTRASFSAVWLLIPPVHSPQFRAEQFHVRCASTTPQDYPEWSGFGGRREREWGHRRQWPRGSMRRTQPCASTSLATTELPS